MLEAQSRCRVAALLVLAASLVACTAHALPSRLAAAGRGQEARRAVERTLRGRVARASRALDVAGAATKSAPSDGALSVPDGAGGQYIAWYDERDGTADVYLVRVTASGARAPGWPAQGLAICTAPEDQSPTDLIPDGANGVIVTWRDNRATWSTTDLYAQRVNPSGVPQWTANGVLVATGVAYGSRVASDDAGGLLIAWNVGSGTSEDVVGNRVTSAGAVAAGWSTDGIVICGAAKSQSVAGVAGDGAGGGYFVWTDARTAPQHAYGQHMNGAGVAQWAADGIALESSVSGAQARGACEDGSGGLIAMWSTSTLLVGQRFDATGAAQWTAGGVTALGGAYPYQVDLFAGAAGSSFFVSIDTDGTSYEGRAQLLNASGAPQWGAGGVTFVTEDPTSYIQVHTCAPDGLGGALLAWLDTRNGLGAGYTLVTQRVSAAGALQWTPNGVVLTTAPALPTDPVVAADGTGGALLCWLDYAQAAAVVQAQHLDATGTPQLPQNGAQVIDGEVAAQLGGLTVADGANGAWIVWQEWTAAGSDVRTRHLGPTGTPLGPVVVCSAAGRQALLGAFPDGAGGMIVGWEDYGSGNNDLYAQRVSAAGSLLWTTNGLGVSVGPGGHYGASMASDGAGGAFIDWNDDNDYILAQRVSAGGTLPWGTAGVTVCNDPNYPSNGPLVSDGAGGAICAWLDFRDPLNISVYSQRLDSNGAAQWTANGVSIASHGSAGTYPEAMVTDGSHGAIVLVDVSYPTGPGGPYADSLLLQRVDASGAPQWGAIGAVAVALGLGAGDAQLVPDGLGGAIVAWDDTRSPQVDLYAQRVNGAGVTQWTTNGALVCDAADWQIPAGVAGDGAGGAFLSWADSRGHGYYDLYAQHLSSSGASLWTPNGVAVSSAPRGQYGGGIVTDGAGGAIAGWTDNRAGNARYLYAQRIQSSGVVQWATDGVTSVLASLVSASIEAGRASLEWQVSSAGPVRIERATAAQAWSAIAVREPDGDGMVRFDDADVAAGGRYGYRLIVSDEHDEAAAGEVWLEAPSVLALALESPRPNPVRGALVMAFTLPDAAAARLELFDVRGRRMMIREVGGLGAGRHLLRLDEAGRQSGVYFARLTRGGQVCRTRVVLLE